jgi:hypothetical protein
LNTAAANEMTRIREHAGKVKSHANGRLTKYAGGCSGAGDEYRVQTRSDDEHTREKREVDKREERGRQERRER